MTTREDTRVPPRSVLPARSHLARLLAAAVLLGGVLVPASAAGASSGGCDMVRNLLGLCPDAPGAPPAGSGPAPTCGDETPIKADGTQWHCTFDEEFDGTGLDRSTWTVQTTASYGFHSGQECMVDDPDNVSVSGGHLNLTVRDVGEEFICKAPKGGYVTHYTGAAVYTAAFA